MSIETALYSIVSPVLAALTPSVPLFWGRVPASTIEYVSISGVSDRVTQDDDGSDDKQFNIVTRSGMARAREIKDAIASEIQRYKGVVSGVKILSISYVRSVELPDAITGEDIIASEYHMNYEGGIL